MALTGPDGGNLPDIMPASLAGQEGVSSLDWMEINARAFTEQGREAFDPDFGTGMAAMLGNPTLSAAELRRRWDASLATSELNPTELTVSINGTAYRIHLQTEVDGGSG